MKELFIGRELSKKAKELGYDESCLAYYFVSGKIVLAYDINGVKNSTIPYEYTYAIECTAILRQQICEWMRNMHSIDIYVSTDCTTNEILGHGWYVHPLLSTHYSIITDVELDYNTAWNKAIEKAFELISPV